MSTKIVTLTPAQAYCERCEVKYYKKKGHSCKVVKPQATHAARKEEAAPLKGRAKQVTAPQGTGTPSGKASAQAKTGPGVRAAAPQGKSRGSVDNDQDVDDDDDDGDQTGSPQRGVRPGSPSPQRKASRKAVPQAAKSRAVTVHDVDNDDDVVSDAGHQGKRSPKGKKARIVVVDDDDWSDEEEEEEEEEIQLPPRRYKSKRHLSDDDDDEEDFEEPPRQRRRKPGKRPAEHTEEVPKKHRKKKKAVAESSSSDDDDDSESSLDIRPAGFGAEDLAWVEHWMSEPAMTMEAKTNVLMAQTPGDVAKKGPKDELAAHLQLAMAYVKIHPRDQTLANQ